MIRRRISGAGDLEQEGLGRNKVLRPSAAEGRDGDGSRDDPKELRADMGGSEAPTRRRKLH